MFNAIAMNGLFGWAGAASNHDQARAWLDAMAGAGVQHPLAETAAEQYATCALGISRRPLPGSVARDGSRLAALHGNVVWPAPELESLAAERGAAAALLQAHARWGAEVPARIGGTFSLAVVDGERNEALVAVDRLGVRTMCFALRSGVLLFGSTADHVVAHPLAGRQLNLQAIYDYLYAQVVPSPGTIYEGVEKLLPAERLVWRGGRVSRDFYWQMKYLQGRAQDAAKLAPEFGALLDEATRRAVEGTPLAEVGAFLSGGTDSSTVAGVLSRVTGKPAETYSIGFDAPGFDEMEYARVAARHFSLRTHEYYVTPADVARTAAEIATAYDEPFGNASALPTLLCARLAASDGKSVILAGDGGDELFGGNARYAKQKVFEWYWRLPAALRRGLVEPAARALPRAGGPALLRKARSYVEQARIPLPDRMESYNLIEREGPAAVFASEFLASVDPERPAKLARDAYARAATASPVDRMMHLDLKITLADNDLRKVTRMCELAGVEVRFPLLDERVVAFSGRLSPRQKVQGTQLRHFFKWALRDFLPPEILRKTKHGFGVPFGPWLSADRALEDMALGSLEALGSRGWIRPDFVDSLCRAHRSGHAAYYGATIWVVMVLELWLRSRRLA
jgi:asparagine synthase (glutamine-hydrolysing)